MGNESAASCDEASTGQGAQKRQVRGLAAIEQDSDKSRDLEKV